MPDNNFAPDVRALIDNLNASLAQHQNLLTALESAQTAQSSNRDTISSAQNALSEALQAYAQSHSTPPAEALPERAPVLKAMGDQPFYDQKVQLAQAAVSSSRQAIQQQKTALQAAFKTFGQGLWPDKMAAFESAAQALRAACLDLLGVRAGFALEPHYGVPKLIIGKLASQTISGDTFVNSEWITIDNLSGDLWNSVMSLNHDVDQILHCQVG